ncbi:MAG: hypothetical protein ABJB76_08270 [Candidatus Nitrosocosmicus sp.]
MYKIIIISFIAISAILGITIPNSQSLSAQQTAAHILNSITTPFTKFFSDNKDYQHCLENTNSCAPTVNVLYESPSTLVLKSHSMNPLWKAVDKVKKSGYVVNAVTYIPTINGTESYNSFDLLVVMAPTTLQPTPTPPHHP